MIDTTQLQIFRGEVLKELYKFQGDSVKIGVIKKAFSPAEGMPLSRLRSVLHYLRDKKFIEWDQKDEIDSNDDTLRITANGQNIVEGSYSDVGIVVLD